MDIHEDEGGIVGATTFTSLPRSVNQIQQLKQRICQKETNNAPQRKKDELYAVIVKCMEESNKSDTFIQFVKAGPQPLAFLADERQLNDLEQFCTNGQRPSILSIDTTYNCGEFYVTFTRYRHQMVTSKRSGKHPVLLGPTLIHKHKEDDTFAYLANCLIRPNLENILGVGSDRDKATRGFIGTYQIK